MDITKLMIGDWVWCGSNYGKVAEIFILHDSLLITVNNRRNKYFEEVNPFEVTTGAEDIRPIPLTTEILEKNGFIGDGYGILNIDDNSYLEYYYHEHRLRKYWRGIDEWDNHNEVKDITFQCHCYYFHEFQHALKLCGIKKEITL